MTQPTTPPTPTEPIIPGVVLLQAEPGTILTVERTGAHHAELVATADAELGLRIEVELGAAAGYWHPAAGLQRTLSPDWHGRTQTSLVSSAPVGALHDADDRVSFSWAAAEPVDELEISFGVSEERKQFVLQLRAAPKPGGRRLDVLLDSAGGPLAEVVGALGSWLSERTAGEPLPVPPVALEPVYSTWYTFTQDIDADVVEAEARRAVALGCGSVFIDDGWQLYAHGRGYAGCGDWLPDPEKFPDLGGHVRRVHDAGAAVVLWIAPLLLGAQSQTYARLERFAPHRVGGGLSCAILDPRYAEVREHLAATCVRLVTDYDLDGLKIDFLDQAMHYRGSSGGGDLADVGEAMADLLGQVRAALAAAGRADVAFEFRQPYVSPAIARFGQILRAGDCPADAVLNRQRTTDARLLSVGQVIHADPQMWGPTGGAGAVAQQIYAGMFAVPQISMRLADLDAEQTAALAGLLALWRDLAEVTLDGSLAVRGSTSSYTEIRATRTDLDRAVIGVYAPVVVDPGETGEVTVVNATAADRLAVRTGHRSLQGGVLRDASAAQVGEVPAGGRGLVDLAVPPFGSATLLLT